MNLYNTASKSKEPFTPQEKDKVTLYTCGPTVYDYLHIGNWVAYIRWDVLVRILVNSGFEVERVMNITDVGHLISDADEGEDKLESGARRDNMTAWEVAQKYSQDFEKGMRELHLMPPTQMPRATAHIPEQIDLIKNLEANGYTYMTSDGLYYDTSKFPKYAQFAGLNLKGQQEGSRVIANPEKHSPWDFALWKLSPHDQERHMEWESPWGRGFPGWHIECSAMAMKYLGETIDIHTGGIDHIPVHHTNEIAQSEAVTKKPFSNFWLHNNFMMIDGVKISKSLGNTITLTQIVDKGFSLMDFKMLVMQSHYRSESNFTWESISGAKERLQKLRAMADLRWQAKVSAPSGLLDLKKYLDEISAALLDDMNTPMALATLSRLSDSVSVIHPQDVAEFKKFIDYIDSMLGFDLADSQDINQDQKSLIIERDTARERSDFNTADKLRDKLIEQGIELNDTPHGTTWNRT